MVYARVSTRKRSQSTSWPRQLAQLGELARRRGWPVVGKYFDRLSGKEKDRPGLAGAVAEVVQGRAEVLMVDALDRLGRNVRHMLETIDTIEEAGGDLFVVDLGIDTKTPAGRMTLTALATLAEYQRRENVRKVLAGIAYARKKGIRLGRPPSMAPEVLARAVRLRRSRPRPSWRAIVRTLKAEKLGTYYKGTVAGAVGRALQAIAKGRRRWRHDVRAIAPTRSTRSPPASRHLKKGGLKSPPKTRIKNPGKSRLSAARRRRSRIT